MKDQRCEELLVELLEEKRKLDQEREEAHDLQIVTEDLAKENTALKSYIDYLECIDECHACSNCNGELMNTGKNVSEVGGREKIRKMKLLSNRVERALWFVEDKETGQTTQIPF